MKKFTKHSLLAAGASLLPLALAPAAFAQDSSVEAEANENDEEFILVTGSRRAQRSASDTIAPVDVVTGEELAAQADNDVSNLLRTSVPSYNVNTQPISDAATIVRPANLRGLSPDSTLILVNGKRQHRSAVITFLGGGISDGSQSPDVSIYPAGALKQVEVLRDGAASQYGSDAIAGVINFKLNDSAEGGFISAKYGSTYEGDGDNWQISGNIGLPVTDNGFLNISAEYQETDDTSRSVQRDDAAALIAAGNTDVLNPAQIWGQPEVKYDFKSIVNFGFDIGSDHTLYAFGNYATREVEGGFFFRNPTNRGGVFAGPTVDPLTGALDPDGVASVLVGDLSNMTAGDCPAGIPLTQGGLIPDPTILAQVAGDANCFSFVELFPGGFTPRFGGELDDYSVAAGLRGTINIGSGLGYDVSYRYGRNKVDFFINNTVNASLGPNTPTSFDPGGYRQAENLVNVDLTYAMDLGLASDLFIAAGFEYRDEKFTIRQGDDASFALGPLAQPTAAFPLGQGFSSSSNGFGGFTNNSAGSSKEDNTAYYLDLETDIIDALSVQAAIRFEDTKSFGSQTDYKVGALLRATDDFRIRATYSTGYHIPTAGQANVINVTTAFVGGVLRDEGTFPLNSPAGQIAADFVAGNAADGGLGLDRPELGVEKSKSFTMGLAYENGPFSVTLDYFNIKLDDRLSRSSQVNFVSALQFFADQNNVAVMGTSTSQLLAELGAAGAIDRNNFTGFEDLSSFAFFNNAFDTRTQGVDLVFNADLDFVDSGETSLTVAGSYVHTNVTERDPTISDTRVRQLEDNLPNVRGYVTLSHDDQKWRGFVRANFYGKFFEAHLDDGTLPINAGSEMTFDIELTYKFTENMELSAGAQNVFDNYPERNPHSGIAGAEYAVTSPFGFNGGAYYVRGRFSF